MRDKASRRLPAARRRAVVVLLLLGPLNQLGCSASAQQTPDSAWVMDSHEVQSTIEVNHGPDGLVVSWKNCDGSPERAVDMLSIGKLGTFQLDCVLEYADKSRPRLSAGRWVYGSKQEGYVVAGCKPLEPNTDYAVDIDGDVDGWSSFRVLQDGSIKKIGGHCK